jgi:hypothetical protein
MVVARKTTAQRGNNLPATSPARRPKPDPIPAMLIAIWIRVKYCNAMDPTWV